MIVEPKVKDYICTTAHPVGCRENVRQQIEYTKKLGKIDGYKNILIIGASTGYGLASRIASAYGYGASTIGVSFEREAKGKRTATAGWYNTKAFEEFATADGYYAKSINGDAFSTEIKTETINLIKEDLGQVDMIIYSLASPRRTTADGITYTSALKTIDCEFTNKSLDLRTNEITQASVSSATQEEIESTIKVMGGEDWKDWIIALSEAGVLAKNAVTFAYSYIGPVLTYPVYYHGTIGKAKEHLLHTAFEISDMFMDQGLRAYISVNKALVTQSSSAIPVVPLYICILYRLMKEANTHEGCIEQANRLFREKIATEPIIDDEGRIRLDDYEMDADIQEMVMDCWKLVDTDNVASMADIAGYWEDFYHMFGFEFEQVDYNADIEV